MARPKLYYFTRHIIHFSEDSSQCWIAILYIMYFQELPLGTLSLYPVCGEFLQRSLFPCEPFDKIE